MDQLLNVSALHAERLSDIQRHFVDKIGKSNVNEPEIHCSACSDRFTIVIQVVSVDKIDMVSVMSDRPDEVADIALSPSRGTITIYVDFCIRVLVDMPQDGTLLFCNVFGGVEKTSVLPGDCYAISSNGLRRLKNGTFKRKSILINGLLVYVTPVVAKWHFYFSSDNLDIQLARRLDARITDAQYREVLRQWCRRVKTTDAFRVLAHLMDTQQFEAADVMVQIHYF